MARNLDALERLQAKTAAQLTGITMRQRFPLVLLSCFFVVFTSGCYGPDREPGDDPSRSDEGPDGGRPETDPGQTVDKSGWSGGRTTDMGEKADDGNTTLDSASDKATHADE